MGFPIYGLYRNVRPQWVRVLDAMVINSVSIVAILVINRVYFLHSCPLELCMLFFSEEATFCIVINKIINQPQWS